MSDFTDASVQAFPPQKEGSNDIHYFIDGERFVSTSVELTVEAMLAQVGKSPTEWYLVLRHGRDLTEYHAGNLVPIKPGEKFLTVSTGPTPVS